MILIDGKKVAEIIREELKIEIAELKERTGKVPGLVTIVAGDNSASQMYVKSKVKACMELGMSSEAKFLPEETSEQELLELIVEYNKNPRFHGILVQLPLPKKISEAKVINAINPEKDVDGFHPISVGKLVAGNDTFFPCTPAGIQELITRYNVETDGKHMVVVGRSNIVGKPIANIMLQKKKNANCVVTVCHSAAKDLSQYTKNADILVAAIGVPNFITGNMVKDGVVVIDVGINRVEDVTSKKGYKVVGDVEFDSVAPKSSYITPVPGGVGPMTIAMLMKNTLKAFKQTIEPSM